MSRNFYAWVEGDIFPVKELGLSGWKRSYEHGKMGLEISCKIPIPDNDGIFRQCQLVPIGI